MPFKPFTKKTSASSGKWTESKDKADDKRRGIKEGSARDTRLDRARGLPPDVVKKGTKKK